MTGQASLTQYAGRHQELTPAERECLNAVDRGSYGVREYARETGRAPGTVGNLLAHARSKVGGL